MMPMVDARAGAGLVDGRVVGLPDDGSVAVLLADGRCVECSALHVSDTGLTLAEGDEVLVHLRSAGTGVVMGRIGPSRADAVEDEREAVPDELVIEARSSLTLRVGGGSITIREDGRILIRGSDLVSHAARMNRIRGGSVSIN